MNILILTQNHPYQNSGLLILDLYKILIGIKGNKVKIVVHQWDKYPDKNIIPIDTNFYEYQRRILNLSRRIINKLLKFIFGNNIKTEKKIKTHPDYCAQEIDQTKTKFRTKKILNRAGSNPDAILVLIMSYFISYKNLYELNKITGAPIFLYPYDMALFTCGCNYAWDCDGYTKECGLCPAIYSKSQNDQTRINYLFKKKYIEKTNIISIAASAWQWQQLNKSSLFIPKRKVKIMSPTNENFFYPGEKENAKRKLGIPEGKKILLYGAVYSNDKRKGYNEILEALKILYYESSEEFRINILVVIVGENANQLVNNILFNTLVLGYLSYEELAIAYQAADVFLNSSIEDSGPTMINQSIMSGTPVVAFEMGVAPDLVKKDFTGYMAKLKDTKDYANGIMSILKLNESDYKKMSQNCRDLALSLCSYEKVTNDFKILMENITKCE